MVSFSFFFSTDCVSIIFCDQIIQGGAELSNIASLLQQPAENFGNDVSKHLFICLTNP